MTRQEAIDRAKLACRAYRVCAYIHEDRALGWNLRFHAPIEHTIEDGLTTDVVNVHGELVLPIDWGLYQFLDNRGRISRTKGRHV
jgi:hypothetical protein